MRPRRGDPAMRGPQPHAYVPAVKDSAPAGMNLNTMRQEIRYQTSDSEPLGALDCQPARLVVVRLAGLALSGRSYSRQNPIPQHRRAEQPLDTRILQNLKLPLPSQRRAPAEFHS